MPPLLYADDMALLATPAAGLQRQLGLLQAYCQRWGVGRSNTKVQLLSDERTQQAALRAAEPVQPAQLPRPLRSAGH